MNVKLLRKIQRTILKRYQQVDMDVFFDRTGCEEYCGTTACIAGWACTLKMQPKVKLASPLITASRFGSPANTARLELELLITQSERLFYNDAWPIKFSNRLLSTRQGTKRYAQVVSDRIDHFIKTKGNE